MSVVYNDNSCLVSELAAKIRAKGYKIGQRGLFVWLRDKGYLSRSGNGAQLLPSLWCLEWQFMQVKRHVIRHRAKPISYAYTVRITVAGQRFFTAQFISEQRVNILRAEKQPCN